MTSTNGRRGSRADELLADWADLTVRARRLADAPMETRPSGLGVIARLVGPMVFGVAVVLAVGVLMPREPMGVGGRVLLVSPSPGPAQACPVTKPNGVHSDAWPETPLDHGADGIFTALAPDGTIEVAPDGAGLLWRDALFSLAAPAMGPLSIRLDPLSVDARLESPAYRAVQYRDGADGPGILRVDLGFPAEGCWEVVATAGPSQLRFVTRVVRSSDPAREACLVSRPNGAHTSAWPASDLDHGEGGLFTVLWPAGTVLVPESEVDRGGIGWMKFVFQREGAAEGDLRIGGRRFGSEPGDPRGVVRAQIPDGYGTTGIQATAIGFPAEGCWEVIARSGSAQLRFVTRVSHTVTAEPMSSAAP